MSASVSQRLLRVEKYFFDTQQPPCLSTAVVSCYPLNFILIISGIRQTAEIISRVQSFRTVPYFKVAMTSVCKSGFTYCGYALALIYLLTCTDEYLTVVGIYRCVSVGMKYHHGITESAVVPACKYYSTACSGIYIRTVRCAYINASVSGITAVPPAPLPECAAVNRPYILLARIG